MNRRTRISSSLSAMTILALSVALLMIGVMPAMAYDHGQTYDANATYFVPEDIRVSGYGVSQNVEIWINTSVTATDGKIQFNYDPNCADVTSVIKDSAWPQGAVNYGTPGMVIITFGDNTGYSGATKVADMTIESNSTSNCGTLLAHDPSAYLSGISNVNWADGTFLSGEPLVVEKTVWDGSNWVNALGPLDSSWMGKDVIFNITVTAGCLDLSNVMVFDVMDAGLEYNNNANPGANENTTHTANWTTLGSLTAGTSTSIVFNATIIGYGPNANTATANATVDDLAGLGVQASDTATVNTMPPAGIDVNKTVWNGSAWVDEVTGATIGETYRFRCEMHNSGSPGMDLTTIEVWDIISPSLEYADSAMIMTPNGVWRSIEPPTSQTTGTGGETIVNWTIDSFLQDPLTLQPCQTFVIEYDVTVVDYGYDCIVQYARGYCDLAGQWVQGNDTACIDTPKPDLIVSDITVNYDASGVTNLAMGPEYPGTKTQCNNISADITEINGIDVVYPFDVMFEVNGVELDCSPATVPAVMDGSSTVTVYCDCSFRPVAGVQYNISVTVDSSDAIPESDETNNTHWRNLTAVVNGYKGDGWQDGRNITNLQCHEQGTINLVYSTGDSSKWSGYSNKNWTTYAANWSPTDFNIPPTDSCIKKARLYVYYNYDKEPDGDPTDAGDGYHFNLTFNGVEQQVDRHYSDRKSFGSYDYPYGMIAYDVADRFMVTSDNQAEITYTWPTDQYRDLSMTGMLLVVVYNNTETESDRIIWINEGFDSLYARDSYGVSSEEATTYAEFGICGESIPMNEVIGATLVTVAPHANEGGDKNRLYFNDGEWHGVWNSYAGATELGINETDVRTYLTSDSNIAAFQSHKSGPNNPDRGDSMEAANAFLIVEKARASMTVVPDSDECYDVGEQFDVIIDIDPMGAPIMGAQFDLNYNPDAISVLTLAVGDFLDPPVSISHSGIDNVAGVASFAATMTGTQNGVTTPGTFAIVHCIAVGQGATSQLNLTNALAYDNSTPIMQDILVDLYNSEVEVCDNAPPVPVAMSNFTYNNMADKVLSTAYFNSVGSDDDDGIITMYEWTFGDGQTGVGPTPEHAFVVKQYWIGTDASGYYMPAIVTLTVTDDGMPLMDNTTLVDVNVWIGGDANGDGRVNLGDAVMVGYYWGADCYDDPVNGLRWYDNQYADMADLNNDGRVNLLDTIPVGFCWGHTAW